MRPTVILMISCALFAGCKHTDPSEAAARKAESKKSEQKVSKAAPKHAAPAPQAVALNEAAGKVASVNPSLRFVVIDFSLNTLPQVDQRLGVYREGQKVGEVKISGQGRNSIIAADITQGEAKVGDEVRPD